MSMTDKILIVYLIVISVVAIAVTAYDKAVSKIPGHRRIPELRLIVISALGGSLAMYITMLTIRHKTRHIKFMLGIPIIMAFQIIVILWYKLYL